MTAAFTTRALRVDPDAFAKMATDLDQANGDGSAQLRLADAVVVRYDHANEGPDIDIIAASGQAVVAGFQSTLSALSVVEGAFRDAHTALSALEADSDNLWVRSSNLDTGGSADETVVAALDREFADIRRREDTVLDRLAGQVGEASIGDAIVIDNPAVSAVINRQVATAGSGALSLLALRHGLALNDDLSDGSFDDGNLAPEVLATPILIDLDDPRPTGDYTGWWLWSDFEPDAFDVVDKFDEDGRPLLTVADDDRQAIVPDNVRQGRVGDCYFVAAVSSLANSEEGRQHLSEMIADNGDGTYTVVWGDGVEVTVDSDVYVNDRGLPAYGGSSDREFNWFSVLEKSFAVRSDDSYEEIVGGLAGPSWEMLLGEGDATRLRGPTAEDLTEAIAADLGEGRPAALTFDLNDVDGDRDDGSLHEFSVLDIDEAAGLVTIRNPWGESTSFETDMSNELGATIGDDGRYEVPIEDLADIVSLYESYEAA